MQKGQWQYECACGFKLWHTVAKVPLTEETVIELLTTGKTRHKIAGFTSKAGNVFDTCLKYEDDQIKFDFDNPGEPEEVQAENAQPAEVQAEEVQPEEEKPTGGASE
jgi:DNA topoisomerase-3